MSSLAEFEQVAGVHRTPAELTDFMLEVIDRRKESSAMSIQIQGHLPAGGEMDLPYVRAAYECLMKRVEGHFVAR